MARKLESREKALVVVLVAAAVLAWYMSRGPAGTGGGDSAEIAERLLGDPPLVNMERLGGQVVEYDPQGRNLFAYWSPPAPKAEVRPARPAPPKRAPVKRPPPAPVKPQPKVDKPPDIDFRYLGYLGPKDDKIAVFEAGEDLLLARAGDVVQDRFRLVSFKFESVVMGYTEDRFQDRTTELAQQSRPGRRR
jgi:hypothetical protein